MPYFEILSGFKPGMLAYAYGPSYIGGWEEDYLEIEIGSI
jgi:hypothetical protein